MNTEKYPVILYPVQEDVGTTYSVLLPDFPGCVSFGGSYQEALENAQAALDLHVQAMIEAGEALPTASTVDQIRDRAEPEAIYGLIELPVEEVKERALARKSVRINVTFPGDLLRSIDDYCEEKGLARSKFLHTIAEKYLNAEKSPAAASDFGRTLRNGLIHAQWDEIDKSRAWKKIESLLNECTVLLGDDPFRVSGGASSETSSGQFLRAFVLYYSARHAWDKLLSAETGKKEGVDIPVSGKRR